MCEKSHFWKPGTCSCENGKYAESIIGDSVVICSEIRDIIKGASTRTVPTKTVPTKCTLTNLCVLLKTSKEKHLLSYHSTRKLKEIDITDIIKWKVMVH